MFCKHVTAALEKVSRAEPGWSGTPYSYAQNCAHFRVSHILDFPRAGNYAGNEMAGVAIVRKSAREESNPKQDLRDHVAESFNIYQASVAMIAIFDGFLFASLLQFLSRDGPLSPTAQRTIWLMTIALFGFTFAMICFHSASHQVIKHWGFFYPKSGFILAGRWLMNAALFAMFSALAVMLLGKEMRYLAVLVLGGGAYVALFTAIHGHKRRQGKHVVQVD